jgi:hypothetical protein
MLNLAYDKTIVRRNPQRTILYLMNQPVTEYNAESCLYIDHCQKPLPETAQQQYLTLLMFQLLRQTVRK